MKRNIILSIFGGIALFGLVLMLVGFIMGGRLGYFYTKNGQFYYRSQGNYIQLKDLPSWAWQTNSASTPATTPAVQSQNTNNDHGHATAGNDHGTNTVGSQQVQRMQIDIAAGYVEIKTGDTADLQVDGPLEYESHISNGTWTLKTRHELDNIRSNAGRFFRNGEDITTTFTITLPRQMEYMDIEIGFGTSTLDGFDITELDCTTSMGDMTITNTTARDTELDCSMGNIDAINLTTNNLDISCDMGKITFSGNVTNLFTAECAMGAVKASLPRPADFGWTAEVGMGKINVDGNNKIGISGNTQGGNQNARPFFDLEADMGTIEISFS